MFYGRYKCVNCSLQVLSTEQDSANFPLQISYKCIKSPVPDSVALSKEKTCLYNYAGAIAASTPKQRQNLDNWCKATSIETGVEIVN